MDLVHWPILWKQQQLHRIKPPGSEVITTDSDINITTDDGHDITTG